VRDQVPQPYKTGKIIVLHILILYFWYQTGTQTILDRLLASIA